MRRRVVVIIGLLAVVAIGLVAAFRASVQLVRSEIVGALGPGARIGALEVGVRRLSVDDLVLPGTANWPADAALRAGRVAIAPSLLSLLTRQLRIASVDIDTPYVAMLRTRRGKLRIVPTLIGPRARSADGSDGEPAAPRAPRPRTPQAKDEAEVAARSVSVGRIVISQGEVDLYDASVATPPWRIRMVGVDASVESVKAPQPSGRSPLDLKATLDGPSRAGTVSVSGWVDPETKDLELTAKLRGVDLLAFRPYAAHSTTAQLTSGAFDLDLQATVKGGRLNAPGHLVLSDIAFAASGGDRVLGVPREVLMAALAQKNGKIALDFTLSGDVNDPRFSLNEAVAMQVATALVGALGGVSVPGLVQGVGKLGGATFKGADEVGKGVGDVLKGLLHGR